MANLVSLLDPSSTVLGRVPVASGGRTLVMLCVGDVRLIPTYHQRRSFHTTVLSKLHHPSPHFLDYGSMEYSARSVLWVLGSPSGLCVSGTVPVSFLLFVIPSGLLFVLESSVCKYVFPIIFAFWLYLFASMTPELLICSPEGLLVIQAS